jgi:hypothetical protein
MSLTLTIGRDAFKICHREGARTTVWDVSKNDSEESLIQTFKDVIAFVEGAQAHDGHPVFERLRGELERASGGAVPGAGTTATNGWAAVYGSPKPPEHWEGQVEIVKPEEEA